MSHFASTDKSLNTSNLKFIKLVGIDINRDNRLGCHWCYSWCYTTITRQGLCNTLADGMRPSLTTERTFTDKLGTIYTYVWHILKTVVS